MERRCEKCNGTGLGEYINTPCIVCNGEGKIYEETQGSIYAWFENYRKELENYRRELQELRNENEKLKAAITIIYSKGLVEVCDSS